MSGIKGASQDFQRNLELKAQATNNPRLNLKKQYFSKLLNAQRKHYLINVLTKFQHIEAVIGEGMAPSL